MYSFSVPRSTLLHTELSTEMLAIGAELLFSGIIKNCNKVRIEESWFSQQRLLVCNFYRNYQSIPLEQGLQNLSE